MTAQTFNKNWPLTIVVIAITLAAAIIVFTVSKTPLNPTHSAAGDGQSKTTLGGTSGGAVSDHGL